MVSPALEKPLCNPQRKKGYNPTLGLRKRPVKYPRLILGPVSDQSKYNHTRALQLWKNKKEFETIGIIRYENYDPWYVKLSLGQKMLKVKGMELRTIKSLVLREYRSYWRALIASAQKNYEKYKGVHIDEYV